MRTVYQNKVQQEKVKGGESLAQKLVSKHTSKQISWKRWIQFQSAGLQESAGQG